MTQPPEQWSQTLKAKTREALGELAFAPPGDAVCLKHVDGRFGVIAVSDLLGKRLKIIDRETDAETTFTDADELVAAGWALD